jgi:prepilin-type N-terminal cleavage/methylation domain-containing protein/prepilin-type processing-associated H-X9-DG protein
MQRALRTRRNGFTLIELLVVIAIIAILAAILFPVFAQAREKARQTTCTSNVKSLGLAVWMYAQDYDETYPPVWYNPDGHWANVTSPYIGQGGEGPKKLWTQGIMLCPSASMKGWSYSMSTAISPYDSKLGAHRGFSVATVYRPADTIMLAETPQVKQWVAVSAHMAAESSCWGGKNGDGTTHKAYQDSDGTITNVSDGCYSLPRYRHNSGALIAWADGHASWKRKGSLRWCRNVSIDEPGADCLP